MEEYEEDDEFISEVETVTLDSSDDDDEDPKGSAFMRGVEQAVQIRDDPAEEDEEF